MEKHSIFFKSLFMACLVSACFLASGCGQNILSGFEPDISNLSDSLDKAQSAEDYSAIADAATGVIDSTTSTDEEKEAAYLARAEARLGQQDVGTLDVFEDIVTAIDSDGDTLDILTVSADVSELINSSNDINEAETLAGSNGLTDEQNVLKAVTNTMIIVNRFNANFDIDDNSEVQRKNTALSYETSLTNFVTIPDNLGIYNTRARDGFNNANSLSESQLEQVNEVTTDTTAVVALQAAVANNQDYTYSGTTYTFSATPTTNGDTARETKIKNALSAIYGD